jgi:lipopolysaccharide export system protein LptA
MSGRMQGLTRAAAKRMALAPALLCLALAAGPLRAADPPAEAVPQAPPPAAVPGKAPASGKLPLGANAAPQDQNAQGILGLTTKQGGAPVAIEADQGVEWDQNDQRYIARGNAKAVRGEDTVYAQTLTAYYRKTPSGGSDVWRLEAEDDIKITSPNGVVVGDRAIYDVDNSVFVITGKKLNLTSPKVILTARDSLEYYQQKQIAVARGDAVAVKEDRTIKADVLEAHFQPDPQGNLQLTSMEAFDKVLITTPSAVARGAYGNYNYATGIATLKGSVKITRGQDQLDGDCAEVNTNTGVSRLYPCGEAGGQVRGLLVPKEGQGSAKANANPLQLPGSSSSGGSSKGTSSAGGNKGSSHGKMKPEE